MSPSLRAAVAAVTAALSLGGAGVSHAVAAPTPLASAATPHGVAAATALPSTSAEPSPTPSVLGLPPATAAVDVAPVVELVGPAAGVVAPVHALVASTGSIDGALTVDEGEKEKHYTLAGDVFFEPTSAELTERARTDLTTLADQLAELSPSDVTVVGHTDDVDSDEYNQRLSEQRAEAVRQFLLQQVTNLPLSAEGRGESEPVASNETDEGRAANRRVEITAEHAGES